MWEEAYAQLVKQYGLLLVVAAVVVRGAHQMLFAVIE